MWKFWEVPKIPPEMSGFFLNKFNWVIHNCKYANTDNVTVVLQRYFIRVTNYVGSWRRHSNICF